MTEHDEQAIFHAALALRADHRAEYLDIACRDDAMLRSQVESLLEAHESRIGFMQGPAAMLRGEVETHDFEEPDSQIGQYKLLQQIGEGGFGLVYMAEQLEPVRRRVALKIIKLGMDTKQVIGRFEAERQALAMMDHPNIAKVFDAGSTESGRPYFVMELVRGIPITEFCDENKLTTRERLALFMDVCHAVQHAHQKGVIHRDIKPSNVLVTLHDDRPVPKVIDFGIAKATQHRLTERTVFTEFKQFIGSPMYMSPEQAALSGLDVDTRTDVYSLGVLLYELLTGTAPFDASRLRQAAHDEIRRIIREEEPPRPSTRITTLGKNAITLSSRRGTDPGNLSQSLRGELDWIVMKALEKDRVRRYDSPGGFARDVQRFLENEPIEARPASTAYRLRKFATRNKPAITAAALVVIALLLGTITSTWLAVHATTAANEAADQRAVAASEAARARSALVASQFSAAELALEKGQFLGEQGDSNLALLWMARALRTAPVDAVDLRRAIRTNLAAWSHEVHTLESILPVTGRVVTGAFTPGADRLVTGERIGNEGFALRQWDMRTGEPLQPPLRQMRGTVTVMQLDAAAERLAVGYLDGRVELVDVTTSQVHELSSAEQPGPITALAFSPSEDALLIASSARAVSPTEKLDSSLSQILGPGLVQIVDLSTGSPRFEQALRHQRSVWLVAFASSGSTFVTQSSEWLNNQNDPQLHFWKSSGQRLRQPISLSAPALSLALSADAKRIVTGHWDFQARLWTVQDDNDGIEMEKMFRADGPISSVSFHKREPNHVLLSDLNGTTRLWDTRSNRKVGPTLWHQNVIYCAGLSEDGRFAFFGSDRFVHVLRLAASQPRGESSYQADAIPLAIDQANKSVLVQESDGLVRVRDALTGESVGNPISPPHSALWGALDRKNQLVVTVGEDQTAHLWDIKSGQLIRPLDYGERGFGVAISPGGKTVAVGHFGGAVVLWDVESGDEGLKFQHQRGPVFSVQFSRDGKRLLTGAADGTARLWDLVTRRQIGIFPQAAAGVEIAALSPDETQILTNGGGEGSRIWDIHSGSPTGLPLRHQGYINDAAFSVDGRMVLTCGLDGTARLWDLATSRQLGPPIYHGARIALAEFWPDGRTIIVGADTAPFFVPNTGRAPAIFRQIPRPITGADEQIEIWVQKVTGMELDGDGGMRHLDVDEWQTRRRKLVASGVIVDESYD